MTINVTNHVLAQLLSDQANPAVRVGTRFLFVDPGALLKDDGALKGLVTALGGTLEVSDKPQILSMVGKTDEPMLGCLKVTGLPLDNSPLGAVFTPMRLYQVERDRATVYVALINRANETVTVNITHQGSPYRRIPVPLGQFGEARIEIPVLRAGTYKVSVEGADGIDCSFEGTVFSLKPLEAIRREHFQDEGKMLNVRVYLASYGFPLPAGTPVTLELMDGDRRHAKATGIVDARSEVSVGFDVSTAKNELTLRIQLTKDPGKKAEVLIPGSSEADRAFTTVSDLGRQSVVSLLPHDGARAINGMYVSYTEVMLNPPIKSEEIVSDGVVKFESTAVVDVVRVVMIDPVARTTKEYEFRDLKPGDQFEVPAPPMFGYAVIGARVRGEENVVLWEGGRKVLNESTTTIALTVPETVSPGDDFTVSVKTSTPSAVFLIVKDTRVVGDDGPTSLARSIKTRLAGANMLTEEGFATQPLAYVANFYDDVLLGGSATLGSPMGGRLRGDFLGVRAMSAAFLGVEESVMPESLEYMQPKSPLMDAGVTTKVRTQVMTELLTSRQNFKQLYFADVVYTDGVIATEVPILAGDSITTLSIEAFAITGTDTARASKAVPVTKPVFAEISTPAQIAPGSYGLVSTRLLTESGRAMVMATVNGSRVELSANGRVLGADETVETPCDVTFMAEAGEVSVWVTDAKTGNTDMSSKSIARSGYAKWTYDRVGVVTVGETVTADQFGATSLRLIPGLERQVGKLTMTMADLSWKCCEQTVVEAICTLVGIMGGSDDISAYVTHFMEAYEREKSMLLPDGGIAFYPPKGGQPPSRSDHYEHEAAVLLASMRRFIDDPRLPDEVNNAVRALTGMGDKLCPHYGLPRTPEKLTNMRDAFLVLCLDPERTGEAVDFVTKGMVREGQYLVARPEFYPGRWAVETAKRVQTLYGAAVLASANNLVDALSAVNFALSQTDKDGKLPSTGDSLALLEALGVLMKKGVGTVTAPDAKVRINGELDMTIAEALAYTGDIHAITAVNSPVTVAYEVTVVEDWTTQLSAAPLATLVVKPALALHQETVLKANLVGGYKPGDRIQIAFDSSMAAPKHGGDRVLLDIDFEGADTIEVPVATLTPTLDQAGNPAQHLVVGYVYNMFDDTRRAPVAAGYAVAMAA